MSFLSDIEIVSSALDAYYQQSISRQAPVIDQTPIAKLTTELDLKELVKEGGLSGKKLENFISKYLFATTRLHHPAYLSHQCAVPHYSGALGALVDGFTNNVTSIYEMGPGAVCIEFFVINWMLEKVGWQPAPLPPDRLTNNALCGGGVLVHGGSIANLTALIAARSRIAPKVWEEGNPGDLALLASPQCHYSISRAAGILGIGQRSIYALEVDDRGVILPDRLPSTYERLKNDGKKAIALVANACCTSIGLYDPLKEIGNFCREHDLWFHIDGAHGASALLSDRLKTYLDGAYLADSLVWDMHKMLRTPMLCTALLVRNVNTLDQAFQQEASYIFHEKEQPGIDFIHRTIECTKPGIGLRFFMVLAALGEQGLASYVERQFDLAIEAYDYMKRLPGFDCPVSPQANILCFRVQGSDEHQLAIRDELIAKGCFYLSTSDFNGKRYLRLTFMSPETSIEDVKRLVSEIMQFEEISV